MLGSMGVTRLSLAPSDSGRRDWRMGAGPTDLLRHGAAERLGAEVVTVAESGYEEVQRAVAEQVRRAVADEVAPIVLAGNCGASVGVVAGLAARDDLAVVWLDAHGDLNTPEPTTSGFVDGMGRAMRTGRCRTTVPGFRPVPDEHVLLVGARDLDPAERAVLDESRIRLLQARAAEVAAAGFPPRVRRVHLHLDFDVHDSRLVGRANSFAVPDGQNTTKNQHNNKTKNTKNPKKNTTIAAYDPACDGDGGVRA